jgi:hypothetical protein
MEPCIYKDQIDKINDSIPRLEEKINHLVSTTASHTNVIANLINFQTSAQGEERGKADAEAKKLIADELKAQQKRDNWQKVVWVIMVIIAIMSIWAGIYIGGKKSDSVRSDVKEYSKSTTRGASINPARETFDLAKHKSFADSILKVNK